MDQFSIIDDYFDQVVKGLPYEKLARIERAPASSIQDPNSVLAPLGASMPAKVEKPKIIGVDSPVQREEMTVIESEAPRPIDTYNYESKVKEIPFVAENLNKSIERRMRTKNDISQNIGAINQDVESGRGKINDLIAQMETAGTKRYEPNQDLESRILAAEKDYGDNNQAPRDLISEAIISFGPAILGGLSGEAGQLSQRQASKEARQLYEGTRKEEGDRLAKLKEMAGKRYAALLKIKQDDRESWTKEQEAELNRVDKIRQANADILKADLSDREKQEGRLIDVDKDISASAEKGTLAIGEMGSKAEQAAAKLAFDKEQAILKAEQQKERDKFLTSEAEKRARIMARAQAMKQQMPTQTERDAAARYGRAVNSSQNLDALGVNSMDYPGVNDPYFSIKVESFKRGGPINMLIQNAVRDPSARAAITAEAEWGQNFLRDETGAAIKDEELPQEINKVFPRYGDTPEIIAQKAGIRKQYENGLILQMGRSAPPKIEAPIQMQPKKKMTLEEKRKALKERGYK